MNEPHWEDSFVDISQAPFGLTVARSTVCRLCGAWLPGPYRDFDPREVHRMWHQQHQEQS